MTNYSISPDGQRFCLPNEKGSKLEFTRLKTLVEDQRNKNREIVVVLGLGFVGTVMAAVIADSVSKNGNPTKFVIGIQRPSPKSYWKIPLLNKGISPVQAEDPDVDKIIKRCVLEKKTFTATHIDEALVFADVVVVDVQCDYHKDALGDIAKGHADTEALAKAFQTIAQKVKHDTLIVIETTVPPGTTEHIAFPIIRKVFEQRGIKSDPLLAHSYERVMPGKNYVSSIRNYWRVCSGINEESKKRVIAFLNGVLETMKYPLTVLDRPIESETAKIIENSYRATIFAFMNEWSLFAEKCGVDLIKVIDAIKIRPTHNNIAFPGPGIGGYCLPKDGGLGMWGYHNIMGYRDNIFKITPAAININDTRALHVVDLVEDSLKALDRSVHDSNVLLLGASYREDVGDTRYSGSELIVRKLTEMGASVRVHDPLVTRWYEFEEQGSPSAQSITWARFFKNQEKLKDLRINPDIKESFKDVDVAIFAVRHTPYLNLQPDEVVHWIGKNDVIIIDCFGILDDRKIRQYLDLGIKVKGLGRGHIQSLKKE